MYAYRYVNVSHVTLDYIELKCLKTWSFMIWNIADPVGTYTICFVQDKVIVCWAKLPSWRALFTVEIWKDLQVIKRMCCSIL